VKVGIISDTHNCLDRIEKALEVFALEEVSRIYHLGDWSSSSAGMAFKDSRCPVVGVTGNIDGPWWKNKSSLPPCVEVKGAEWVDDLSGRKIFLTHGNRKRRLNAVIKSGEFDLVLHGHTHIASIRRRGRTLVINPGNMIGPEEGFPHWTDPSVCVYDLDHDRAEIVELRQY
jgi:uncharacterized protein